MTNKKAISTAQTERPDPRFICRMASGTVYLSTMQFLRGYCILVADPQIESINVLSPQARASFLSDMVIVGDAILKVTDAYRINYALMGNSDPILHAHIVPRYQSEPEELRKGLPWSHPDAYAETTCFDAQRDGELILKLKIALSSLK